MILCLQHEIRLLPGRTNVPIHNVGTFVAFHPLNNSCSYLFARKNRSLSPRMRRNTQTLDI